jgi:hypothetical protein
LSNEKSIQQRLRTWADNHKYVLVNSFVFDWESDFFSVTKTGTVNEVEIKVSKTDFKKDFGKEKHRVFKQILEGKKFIVERSNYFQRDLLATFEYAYLQFRRGYKEEFDQTFGHEEDAFGYWQRRDRHMYLQTSTGRDYAPACGVAITPIEQYRVPNKFFYACPPGLIEVDELPAYAGLIWVYETKCIIKKQAPFIHKNKITLTMYSVLLDKFWYLSQEMRGHLVRHSIDFKDCKEEKI